MSLDAIVGTWDVALVQSGIVRFRYKYTCTVAGAVRWTDYHDNTETGGGTWKKSGNQIVFDWKDSATREYWIPDRNEATGAVDATYGKFSIEATRTDTHEPTKDLMRQWADNYGDFKFDKLAEDSGAYQVEITSKGRKKIAEARLVTSINLGEIRL